MVWGSEIWVGVGWEGGVRWGLGQSMVGPRGRGRAG